MLILHGFSASQLRYDSTRAGIKSLQFLTLSILYDSDRWNSDYRWLKSHDEIEAAWFSAFDGLKNRWLYFMTSPDYIQAHESSSRAFLNSMRAYWF